MTPVTLKCWSFLLIVFCIVWRLHRRSYKKEVLSLEASKRWNDAGEKVTQYVNDFSEKLNNDVMYKPSSSLEEIDMFDPYETVTYKNLAKQYHRAWISYLEVNRWLVHKDELIVFLGEIQDDEELTHRVLTLIFKT
ncbi:MAG TPA: hypothetical protein VL576_02675 [Candidatus Paceibacterota bacterium]|jgi:hypothetical protein|nr:hypothetical protein [Candidatus Paceibacterota bacterium]